MIVLGIIIAGLAAYLVYALVYPEKLQLKTHEEEDNNVSDINNIAYLHGSGDSDRHLPVPCGNKTENICGSCI